MAAGAFLRRCHRTLVDIPRLTPQLTSHPHHHYPRFLTTTTATPASTALTDFSQPLPEVAPRTRLTPLSPSYYTGSPEYYDNLLALQDLLRSHQALPTIHGDDAPGVQWKTLEEYRLIIGDQVKPSRYNKIVRILDRLNRIDPAIMPAETKAALALYARPENPELRRRAERTVDNFGRAYAIGRRKTAVARVFLVEGEGEVLVNGLPIVKKFSRMHDRESVLWPLIVSGRVDKYNVFAVVKGGGKTGQAEACTLAIARALRIHEPALKHVLREAGCVTVDHRQVERKKPGHVKARKMPAWVKR
ncbi:hypothetical protein L873DRAFT_1798178 [Choiromyces venosus 120613-1]|uniref:Small ribosomal subunit protein uS9m n=1 Tax=Choiromyces venosus 120613-1 TaxID=1336337 RepID=A0A3N4K6S7_9PEZI|nr:hypothetical protein L873DRAFT_1798178 [Choiromyces venosus 120613-1]